jgi:hypothetical protein
MRLPGGRSNQRATSGKNEIAKLDALNKKLSAILDFAHPYDGADLMGDEVGSEQILILNRGVVAQTRAKAKRANKAA